LILFLVLLHLSMYLGTTYGIRNKVQDACDYCCLFNGKLNVKCIDTRNVLNPPP